MVQEDCQWTTMAIKRPAEGSVFSSKPATPSHLQRSLRTKATIASKDPAMADPNNAIAIAPSHPYGPAFIAIMKPTPMPAAGAKSDATVKPVPSFVLVLLNRPKTVSLGNPVN